MAVRLLALTLFVASIFLTASPLKAAEGVAQDGKLHLFFTEAPVTLNPHLSDRPQDLAAARIVYEPLASYDASGQLVPFLAADIPSRQNGAISPDGRRVIWTLKPGVMWADGRPFTAADVVFTYHYIIYSPSAAHAKAYSQIQGVEALDDRSVKVTFKSSQANWQLPFVGADGMILPRHIFAPYIGAAANEADVNLQGAGTGPYRAVNFTSEDVLLLDDQVTATTKVIYEPNPYFRERDKPAFSVVELQAGGDSMIAAKAADAGLTDFAWNLADNPLALKLLDKEESHAGIRSNSWVEGLTLAFQDTIRGGRGAANALPTASVDWRLRQALLHSIDRDAILDIYRDAGHTTVTESIWQQPTGSENPFDLSRSKQLLVEAGWVDVDGDGQRERAGLPLAVFLPSSNDPMQQKILKSIAANLTSAGVAIGPTLSRTEAFFGPLTGRDAWDLPPSALSVEIDKLPEKTLYQPASFPAATDDPSSTVIVPLVMFNESAGVNKSLSGVVLNPWDSPLWNIKDWHRK